MLLSKEQVDLMSSEDCEQHLKLLDKTYALDKPITAEIWPQVDAIANTLLYCEERIRYIQQSENAIQANKIRYGRE